MTLYLMIRWIGEVYCGSWDIMERDMKRRWRFMGQQPSGYQAETQSLAYY